MTLRSPIAFTPDVESVDPAETKTIEQLNQTFDQILETTAKDYGHAVLSVHAKAHGILAGTLTMHPNLPPELAQGMFKSPGEHEVYMRLSTNAGDILPDTISLPRGLAVKVLDVDGERLPGAEGRTQNFVMVNGPVFQTKTSEQFLGSLKKLAGTTDRLEGTKEVVSTILRGVKPRCRPSVSRVPRCNSWEARPTSIRWGTPTIASRRSAMATTLPSSAFLLSRLA